MRQRYLSAKKVIGLLTKIAPKLQNLYWIIKEPTRRLIIESGYGRNGHSHYYFNDNNRNRKLAPLNSRTSCLQLDL